MSTQINITVDSGGLSERAKQQQQAARQAQLEKERVLNLDAKALDKRAANQAAKGLSVTGQPLFSTNFTQPKFKRRPAANRTSVQADFYVVSYSFTTGRDLDTRTQLFNPLTETYSNAVGWCKDDVITYNGQNIVTWGGDNTGLGVEAVLFDRLKYVEVFGNTFTPQLSLRAFWYSQKGDNVVILVTGYKGGDMVKTGFSWLNPTATKSWTDFANYPSTAVQTNLAQCIDGDYIVTLNIEYRRGTVSFVV